MVILTIKRGDIMETIGVSEFVYNSCKPSSTDQKVQEDKLQVTVKTLIPALQQEQKKISGLADYMHAKKITAIYVGIGALGALMLSAGITGCAGVLVAVPTGAFLTLTGLASAGIVLSVSLLLSLGLVLFLISLSGCSPAFNEHASVFQHYRKQQDELDKLIR